MIQRTLLPSRGVGSGTTSRAARSVACAASGAKRALITGGNRGMGYETALALLKKDFEVTIACRHDDAAAAAKDRLLKAVPSGVVNTEHLDLADLASIRECAARLEDQEPFDVLHNNAGVVSRVRKESRDGFELHWATNFLGPYTLTSLMLPKLLESNKPVRIVSIASLVHLIAKIDFTDISRDKGTLRPLPFTWDAYGQSKLAIVMWTYEMARRLQSTNVAINSVHPGTVNTPLGREFAAVVMGETLAKTFADVFYTSPDKGATTAIHVCSSPEVEGISGKYWAYKRPVRSSLFSYKTDVAQRLLEVAEQQTGIAPVPAKVPEYESARRV